MTNDEYWNALVTVHLCLARLRSIPLHGIMAAADKAATVGPILDPTTYREKGVALEQDSRVIRAARDFVLQVTKDYPDPAVSPEGRPRVTGHTTSETVGVALGQHGLATFIVPKRR